MAMVAPLFVDVAGMESLGHCLNGVAGILDGQDTLTYGLPLSRPRIEHSLANVLEERRRRWALVGEELADLAQQVRAACAAYVGADEAAAAAAKRMA
ncbi:MAG TPA: hypothetical protein VEG38_05795 [Acidimicrobiia bacterium]|nr:hypothetical protein [Acidimicrobiia bacterium]